MDKIAKIQLQSTVYQNLFKIWCYLFYYQSTISTSIMCVCVYICIIYTQTHTCIHRTTQIKQPLRKIAHRSSGVSI